MRAALFSLFLVVIPSLYVVYNKVKKNGPDPNFYIFLAFGQSNMEGAGPIEEIDLKDVPERFQMMAAVDMPVEGRKKGQWYTAVPPLCRSYTKLCPMDYFGRLMVESLPKNIRIGVINISVSGCSIDMYDEDKCAEYIKTAPDWMKEIAKQYENNPFRYLVNRAKEAQQIGVIKGFMFHQGETNTGDKTWPENVKRIYYRLLNELNLKEENCPFLAGELVTKEQGGCCWGHNEIINTLPSVIPNAHVISAEGLPPREDNTHFTSASYRLFGKRYAVKMLSLLLNKTEDEVELDMDDQEYFKSKWFY